MKKFLKCTGIGVLIGAIVGCTAVCSKDAAESITAVYRNIKLVVDGVQIEPKDVNGNIVEPFIYNGTTYLPVRAVGQAFNKQVEWNGDTSTVYLGGVVNKPAKELPMWNRSYLENSNAKNISSYEDKGIGYIKYHEDGGGEEISGGRYLETDFVKYPLNTLAKSVSGEFYVTGDGASEGKLKILNSNGEVIYESPIMRTSTAPVKFDVKVENDISLTFKFERINDNKYDNFNFYIKNPTIVSSDY